MALVTETGAGLTNAESYASVADANAYFTGRTGSTTWASATDAQKEQALRDGTTYIDLAYSGHWLGTRSHETQALDFPRGWISDRDGYPIQSDVIPTKLKYATCEAAVKALSEDLMPDIVNSGVLEEEDVSVGPVRSKVKYLGGSQIKYYRKVTNYVLEFIRPVNEVERA